MKLYLLGLVAQTHFNTSNSLDIKLARQKYDKFKIKQISNEEDFTLFNSSRTVIVFIAFKLITDKMYAEVNPKFSKRRRQVMLYFCASFLKVFLV